VAVVGLGVVGRNVGIRVDGVAVVGLGVVGRNVGMRVDGLAVGLRVAVGLNVGFPVGLGVGHPLVYTGLANTHFPLTQVSTPDNKNRGVIWQ